MRPLYGVMTGMLAAMTLAGCSTADTGTEGGILQQLTPAEFSSRRIVGAPEVVEEAATRVFRSHFLLDAEASSSNHLVSRTTEVEGRGNPTNVRDRIRLSPSRHRQTAELRMRTDGNVVIVQVGVRTQRLETSERASFAQQRGDDRPTKTAIDRPGPGGVDTREQWVSAGRDTATERQVLDEIQAAVSPSTQAE